jgi:hypothetical protein
MDSGPSTFLTDYLVICGQASARRCNPPAPISDDPLNSRSNIIAQFLCPVQRSLIERFQLSPSFCAPIRVLGCKGLRQRLSSPFASNPDPRPGTGEQTERTGENVSMTVRRGRHTTIGHNGIACTPSNCLSPGFMCFLPDSRLGFRPSAALNWWLSINSSSGTIASRLHLGDLSVSRFSF